MSLKKKTDKKLGLVYIFVFFIEIACFDFNDFHIRMPLYKYIGTYACACMCVVVCTCMHGCIEHLTCVHACMRERTICNSPPQVLKLVSLAVSPSVCVCVGGGGVVL